MKEELLETQPVFRAAQILQAMISPDDEAALVFELGPIAIADAALLAASLFKIAAKTRGILNTLKMANQLGDGATVGRAVVTVLADPTDTAQAAWGIDKLTAQNWLLPWGSAVLSPLRHIKR